VVRTDVWSRDAAAAVHLFFWRQVVLHPHARKVVYDAKAFLGCVLSVYEEGEVEVGEARLINPLVGCWLHQPDRPAASFRSCLDTLGLARPAGLGALSSRLAIAGDLGLLSANGSSAGCRASTSGASFTSWRCGCCRSWPGWSGAG
jgi:hypothetical protein